MICDDRKLSASVLSQTIVNAGGRCFHLNLKQSQISVKLILCEVRRKGALKDFQQNGAKDLPKGRSRFAHRYYVRQ